MGDRWRVSIEHLMFCRIVLTKADMIFKVLSTDVVGQGLYFAQDMKLGHYMKIPPRTLFFAQGSATVKFSALRCHSSLILPRFSAL